MVYPGGGRRGNRLGRKKVGGRLPGPLGKRGEEDEADLRVFVNGREGRLVSILGAKLAFEPVADFVIGRVHALQVAHGLQEVASHLLRQIKFHKFAGFL